MMSDRTAQYPYDLAQLVAQRLQAEHVESPPESVLVRLFEILYFASFHTDEGRRILCTVNYVDPATLASSPDEPVNQWRHVAFERPLPLDVRTLTKLARAADPNVSSLAVSADASGDLYIWGLFDQEPRHGDYITLAGCEDFVIVRQPEEVVHLIGIESPGLTAAPAIAERVCALL